MKRFAMFSAANEGKTPELAGFVNALLDRNFTIWASGGTFKYLGPRTNERMIVDIADIVGPEILNHRVVTLDRKVFAGVLSRLDNPTEQTELEGLIGGVVELVHMDIYHLGAAIEKELAKSKEERNWEAVRESIDIGGPAFLRAAAKGNRYVTTSPHDRFREILERIDDTDQSQRSQLLTRRLKLELAMNAENVAATHCGLAQQVYGHLLNKVREEEHDLVA